MNGIVKEQQRSVTPSSYLGKRKRSSSPEKPQLNGNAHRVDANIDNIVRDIKKYDIAPSLLEHILPASSSDGPILKKQKTDIPDNTIEGRLALDWYSDTSAFLKDLQQAIADVRKDGSTVDGDEEHKVFSELDEIDTLLSEYSHQTTSTSTSGKNPPVVSAGQVMTVRSNIEGGATKQLFTGLRLQPSASVKQEEIDIRKLPSGFDVVEATAFDPKQQPLQKDSRTFGDVFRQQRNARQLEMPKASRGVHSTHLRFAKPFENAHFANKDDYRIAALSPGSWLEYSASETDVTRPPNQRSTIQSRDPESLFRASFSSFAPSEDNTTAIVSRADRSRLWYRKYGSHAIRKIIGRSEIDQTSNPSEYPEINDDFQQLIDDYVPVTADNLDPDASEQSDDTKDILDEISELLQTLTSYQQIRDLDRTRVLNTPIKPAGLEMDTFDVLRQHLSILVAALPPFAVAKLDGDKLKALNISTNILIETPDIAGTGQPDEGTIHRQRMAQAQQAAMNRPINSVPTRNSYAAASTPNPNYSAQPRSYSTSSQTPSLPGYAQRTAQMYATPRPNMSNSPTNYGPNPAYSRPQQPYPGATIQQYQRLQNGYGQNVQTPYQSRTGQASYQSQTSLQNNAQYNRSASPAKPLTNGQSYAPQTPQAQNVQPQRNQYSTPAPSTSLLQGSYAQANAHATIQQVKAAAQMQAQQSQSQSPQPQPMQGVQQTDNAAVQAQQSRQESGTPQPHANSTNQDRPATQSTTAVQAGEAVNGNTGQSENPERTPHDRDTITPQPAQSATVEANA